MKILYHHRIASKDGQYVHIEELTNALRNLGNELIIVSPSVSKGEEFGSESGFVKLLKQKMPRFIYELLEFAYSLHAYRKLTKIIEKYKPDIIYERYNLFMLAGAWVKRKYNIPFFLEVNAPLFEERKKYSGISLSSLAKWSERYVWENADSVLPVTHVLAKKIMKEGVDENHICVIPNGVNLERFDSYSEKNNIKERLNLRNCIVLGFTGFVREWHGLERVVDLIADNKEESLHLLIIGDGPACPNIRKRANESGIIERITITGVVGRDEISKYIAAFDVALQPDVVDYASPLKLFEYMALGCAIVAPDKENIREVLTNRKNCLLFNPNVENDFFSKIIYLIKDEQLRKILEMRLETLY